MNNYSRNKILARGLGFALAMLISLFSIHGHAADAPRFTAQTSMAVILDNAAARAVMVKYIPAVMADPQIEGARVISLGELAGYIPELSTEVMAKVLADLNNLPAA